MQSINACKLVPEPEMSTPSLSDIPVNHLSGTRNTLSHHKGLKTLLGKTLCHVVNIIRIDNKRHSYSHIKRAVLLIE